MCLQRAATPRSGPWRKRSDGHPTRSPAAGSSAVLQHTPCPQHSPCCTKPSLWQRTAPVYRTASASALSCSCSACSSTAPVAPHSPCVRAHLVLERLQVALLLLLLRQLALAALPLLQLLQSPQHRARANGQGEQPSRKEVGKTAPTEASLANRGKPGKEPTAASNTSSRSKIETGVEESFIGCSCCMTHLLNNVL